MRIDHYFIKALFILFLLSGFISMNGQSLIKQEIDNRINQRVEFQEFSPFTLTSLNDPEIEDAVKDPTLLKLDKTEIKRLYNLAPENIELTIPVKGSNSIKIALYRNTSIPEELVFRFKRNTGKQEKTDHGVHYWGINPAAGNSLAAISIFEDDLKGLISDDSGNWNLGKLENQEDIFIFYNDKNVQHYSPNLSCGTDDDLSIPVPKGTTGNKGNNPKCVDIYVEVNYDIYLGTGGGANAFVTTLFNQSAILYANRGITIRLSDVFVWNVPSPYNGANSGQMLSQFQAQTNSWNGDIAHLLTYDAYGGLAATINGLCHPNIDIRMCYSGIENNIVNNIPIYSWTVYVFSHENGHLLGSPHTHNCSWNNNNTAIDGCWTPEGSCSQPGIPPNGGTVMSYCHLQAVGVNFANGFHPQSGSRMLAAINAAGCIQNCTGPSCSVSVSPTFVVANGSGGNNSVQVTATSGQVWNASSNASWINVTTNSGVGSGTLAFNVSPNNGAPRSGTVSISCGTSSASFTVSQAGGPSCTVSVSPSAVNVGAGGGNNSVQVIGTSGQVWNASSNAFWINVTTTSGNGSGTLGFNVTPNSGAARSGTISVSCGSSSASVSVFQADGSCVPNLTLNGSESGTKNYSASNSVTSTQNLNGSSNIDYSGGNQVRLKPGFRAFPGAEFHGYIASCVNGSPSGPGTANKQSSVPSNHHILNKGVVTIQGQSNHRSIVLDLKASSSFSFQVQNVDGQVVLSEQHQQLSADRYEFELDGLSSGIYYVTVAVGEELKSVKLVLEE